MRISDWSSDVCSSDLVERRAAVPGLVVVLRAFEDQVPGEIAVALQAGDEVAEEGVVAQRVTGDVAEEVELHAAVLHLAHTLDAAYKPPVIDAGDDALALGPADLQSRQDHDHIRVAPPTKPPHKTP